MVVLCVRGRQSGRAGHLPGLRPPGQHVHGVRDCGQGGEPGSTSSGMCSYSACTHARGSDQPFDSADIKRLRRSPTREERSILVLCRRRSCRRGSHCCRPDLGRQRPVAPHGRRWSGHARILGSVRLDSSGRTRCLGARRAMRGIARLHRHRVPYESQIGLVDRRGAAWNPGTEDPAWLTSLRAAVTTGDTFRAFPEQFQRSMKNTGSADLHGEIQDFARVCHVCGGSNPAEQGACGNATLISMAQGWLQHETRRRPAIQALNRFSESRQTSVGCIEGPDCLCVAVVFR